MSLQTWKEEFYPIPASECRKEDAVKHSLRKWIGLKKENLKKHGLRHLGGSWISEVENNENGIVTSSPSCALCTLFVCGPESGIRCPILGFSGRTCDDQYQCFTVDKHPECMIKLLSEVDVWYDEQLKLDQEILEQNTRREAELEE
jgi:hypothetical protein